MSAYRDALVALLRGLPRERRVWERLRPEEEAAVLRLWVRDMERPVPDVFADLPGELERMRLGRVHRKMRARSAWSPAVAARLEEARLRQAFRWLVLTAEGLPPFDLVSESVSEFFRKSDAPRVKVRGAFGPSFWLWTIEQVMRGPVRLVRPGGRVLVMNFHPGWCSQPGVYGPRVFEVERQVVDEVKAWRARRTASALPPRDPCEWIPLDRVDFGDGRGPVGAVDLAADVLDVPFMEDGHGG